MSDQFSLLKRQYKHNVPAEALFFNVNGRKALRLEVPEIGKEFTDGLYIGKGALFYPHDMMFAYSGGFDTVKILRAPFTTTTSTVLTQGEPSSTSQFASSTRSITSPAAGSSSSPPQRLSATLRFVLRVVVAGYGLTVHHDTSSSVTIQ